MKNLKGTAIFTLLYMVLMNLTNANGISEAFAGASYIEIFLVNILIFLFYWSVLYIFHIGTQFLYKFMMRGR